MLLLFVTQPAASTGTTGDDLQLENGGYILQEDGSYVLLDAGSANTAASELLQEDGTLILQEDGSTIILDAASGAGNTDADELLQEDGFLILQENGFNILLDAAAEAANTNLANSGGGAGRRELWRVYQEILAADLKRKPETKKRKRKKVVEPVLDLPIGGLDGLRAEIATEQAAIAALEAREQAKRKARAVIRQRREAQERIEWLATQERALEAAIAEVEKRRRKRNNETAMLLLAA